MRALISGALGIAIVGTLTAVSTSAHEHATGVVKERMDAMESMAKAMKSITRRVRDNRDVDQVKADARSIHTLAQKVSSLFPPGSNQHPSEARESIWQNWSDFEARARSLAAESGKLASADARDAKSLDAQARAVSQACGQCHEKYRLKQ
jgi:cytochrome c556